ncbi:hypothetical protein SNOG_12111 [Parastagonospora nodorum SN15]|uniref:Uncharacterized protein n=1 Tax=Phaeosphaeria nodorum (strain SN15 / ATCC MYA-4574 / FGSC 10173) TaxID=321614 RepID=Q0U803_PHANO|nr:hypothetical protein SNOG_12111 [Parastagonospora nodorum SN15]EAT80523.1 hypothetical protein SNOG_12111 [Parastagonospora nodorum SN15]
MYFFAGQHALSPIRLRPSGTDSSNKVDRSAEPSLLGSGVHALSRRLHAGRMLQLQLPAVPRNTSAPRISPPSPPPHV